MLTSGSVLRDTLVLLRELYVVLEIQTGVSKLQGKRLNPCAVSVPHNWLPFSRNIEQEY